MEAHHDLGLQDVSQIRPSGPPLDRIGPIPQIENPSQAIDPRLSSFHSTPKKRSSFQAARPSITPEIVVEGHSLHAPMPKRRRLEGEVDIDYARTSNVPDTSSSPQPSPSQGPKCSTVWACGLWKLQNPGKRPPEHVIKGLSCICKDSLEVVKNIFETSERTYDDRQTPNILTTSACELWKLMNPDEKPTQSQVTVLSMTFGDSPKSLSDWFIRNPSSRPNFEDSGNCTMTQTRTSSDSEIASKWRHNRKYCCRKSGQQATVRKNPQRKYICTSFCGSTFDSKESWKKHEQNNRVQELWLCGVAPCHQSPEKFGWSRKDQLSNHIKKQHPGHHEIQGHGIKIQANVRGNCLWRECDETFHHFEGFLQHTAEHFDTDWVITDLRDADEETNAPMHISSIDNDDQDPNIDDSDNDYDGSPPPNAGAGPSSGYQRDSHQPSGPDDRRSGQGNTGAGSSHTTGYQTNTRAGNAMQLATVNSFKSLHDSASALLTASRTVSMKHMWHKMASLPPKVSFLSRLGYGSTAVVDEVKVSGVSGTVACKLFSTKWRPEVLRELETMSKLEHPHIVKLVYGCLEGGSTAILMQPVADYNLSQYLAACASMTDEQSDIWVWFSCLTSGLQYMHENGVRHHDIKPSNILVKDNKVLFADFGSSSTIRNDQSRTYHTFKFTSLYAAPEVLNGERWMASDVFSLGCVFLEMITILLSRDLWQELRILQERSYQGKITTVHWACKWNQTLVEFASNTVTETNIQVLLCICQTMTDPKPERRPSAADIEGELELKLRRPCSYSPTFNSGRKASTWPTDHSAIRDHTQWNKEQSTTLENETAQAEVDEISQTSQDLERLALTDSPTPKTNTPPDKSSENTAIKEESPGSKHRRSENMMPTFLRHRDRREEFRISGRTTARQLIKNVKRSRRSLLEWPAGGIP